MVKDRIGNVLTVGDKVIAQLPDASLVGFVSEVQEPSVLRTNDRSPMPGRVLITCVIALPVDPNFNATGNLVKVYDADKEATQATLDAMKLSDQPKAN